MGNPFKERELWEVVVEAHRVAGRYDVPARTCQLGHATAQGAKRRVLLWAHADAGVPPWKPCLRESWPFVSAQRIVVKL